MAEPHALHASRHRRSRARRVLSSTLLATLAVTTLTLEAGASPTGASPTRSVEGTSTVSIRGGGWGHGLGMSQYGACGMAVAGFTPAQILGHFYRGTQVQDLAQPTGIRVRVAVSTRPVVSPQVAPVVFAHNGTSVATAQPGESVAVVPSGAGFVIEGKTGPLPAGVLSIGLPGGRRPVRVTPPGNRYDRGQIVMRNIGGTLQVTVERLPMQDYLLGLAEVPSSWPDGVLRAQAIAGRTYAKNAIDRRRAADPARTWDLDGSVADQVYAGFEKEEQGGRWLDAVLATNGDTVTYQGAAIQAFYSSSDGGHTENNEYVWGGTPLPYLRGVPDPWDGGCGNPNHVWARHYMTDELTRWLGRFTDTNVGTVRDIRMAAPFGVSGRVDRATATLIGSAGSKLVTGSRLRSVINAGITAEGGGLSRQLLGTKFVLEGGNPIGNIDIRQQGPTGVRVAGWVFDPNTDASTQIHIYFDQTGHARTAALARPDVQQAYALASPNHGFDVTLTPPPRLSRMCVYGYNVGPGTHTLFGCWAVRAGSPFGSFDAVRRGPLGVGISGWAIDPETAGPINLHAYLGGAGAVRVANSPRPDVGRLYPAYGDNHGFATHLDPVEGTHSLCVFGINVGPGANSLLGCRAITVAVDPFGSVDLVQLAGGSVRVRGWAIDPDTAGAVHIHVYVDGRARSIGAASQDRPDVGRAYPGYGSAHGFDAFAGPGRPGSRVCVYAINVGVGANNLLGCRTV